MINDRKFKVLEKEGKSGLTVGSFSRKPGYVFALSQWNGDIESLEAAIENKRCVEISDKKSEKKVSVKEENTEEKKSDKKSKGLSDDS